MHDAGHAPPGRRLQRQHGAAAALGDEVVLEVLGDGRVVRDLAQPLGQLPAALAELAAQAAQRRRGRVLQVGAVLLDRAPDLLGDGEQRRGRSRRRAPSASGSRPARRARGAPSPRRGSCARSAPASGCRACCRGPRGRPPRSRRLRRRGRARPPRRAARSPPSSVAGAAPTSSASADGRRASASSAPGSLAAAPASRASTAGSSRSSRSCSRMGRVYGRAAALYRLPVEGLRSRVVRYRDSLPQLDGRLLLTDGGMETTLIFDDGLELPCFATFPLLESEEGRAAMTRLLRAVSRRRPAVTAPASCSRPTRGGRTRPGARGSATPSTSSPRQTGAASRSSRRSASARTNRAAPS